MRPWLIPALALAAMAGSSLVPGPLQILYTPTAVLIGLVYTYLPFMILPIYSSAEKIDGSLLEASMNLGAGPWRTMWHVVLPLTKPGVFAGILLVFVPSIGMFAVNDLMGGSRSWHVKPGRNDIWGFRVPSTLVIHLPNL